MPEAPISSVTGGEIFKETMRDGSVNRYRKGHFLGRGGFAQCFMVTNIDNSVSYACKVIDKKTILKPRTQQKLRSEIAIHSRLMHHNIVRFYRHFEDASNHYFLLELCTRQSLMELQKKRKLFTEDEARYIMTQLFEGVAYMHQRNVIHRDLKLGNIMLDEKFNLKIGDFGLAAQLAHDGERKTTVCGTPNYIAPEIISNDPSQGHSFEVDIWSCGVILFTLLCGSPPFETNDIKQTYHRIRHLKYAFPPNVSLTEEARRLVQSILQADPKARPSLENLMRDPWFTNHSIPMEAPQSFYSSSSHSRTASAHAAHHQAAPVAVPTRAPSVPRAGSVPAGALTDRVTDRDRNRAGLPLRRASAVPPPSSPRTGAGFPTPATVSSPRAGVSPRAATAVPSSVVPLSGSARPVSAFRDFDRVGRMGGTVANGAGASPRRPLTSIPMSIGTDTSPRHVPTSTALPPVVAPAAGWGNTMAPVISAAGGANIVASVGNMAGAVGSAGAPHVWISLYSDFSNRYGMAFKFSNGMFGAYYNDATKMTFDPETGKVEYYAINRDAGTARGRREETTSCTLEEFPESLNKKITLIKYFKNNFAKNIGKADCPNPVITSNPNTSKRCPDSRMFVNVRTWQKHDQGMFFRLSNQMYQVSFNDGEDIMVGTDRKVVTYTNRDGKTVTFPHIQQPNDPAISAKVDYAIQLITDANNRRQ